MTDIIALEDCTAAPQVQRLNNATLVKRGPAPRYAPITAEEIATVAAMHAEGKSRAEICAVFGWPPVRWETLRAPGGPLAFIPSRRGQRSDLADRGLRLCVDVATPAIRAEVEQRRRGVFEGWDQATREARRGVPLHEREVDGAWASAPARGTIPTRQHRGGRW